MELDLGVETERMRSCARKQDSESRKIVLEALESEWEGLQSVALQLLGGWGDDDSRARLRCFVEAASERPNGWAIQGVAIRSLASCITAADADWALTQNEVGAIVGRWSESRNF